MKDLMKEIYILEDDEGIRELVSVLLQLEGFKVSSFSSVENFKHAIGESTPDLFLLDISLPDGDGRKVCRELRGSNPTAHIPVVLMSANRIPGVTVGANDFIPKPFDVDEFLSRIKTQLAS